MIRNLKIFGLAITAVFALSAMAASAASATAFEGFNTATSKTEGGTFSGSQTTTHKFTAGTGVGTVTCAKATFSGTSATGKETEPAVTPTYSDCHTVILGVTYKVHINMGDCFIVFHITGGSGDIFTGHFDIVCTGPFPIIIIITKSGSEETKCKITIGAQAGLNNVSYSNNTVGNDIEVATTTNNIKDTTEGGLAGCGIGNGEHTNGTYEGTTTMEAKNSGGTKIDLTIM